MKAPKWRKTILDKPKPLVWVDIPMPCRRCGQPSHWRTPQSTVNGVHPWCDSTPFERLSDDAFIDVLYGVVATVGAQMIRTERPAPTTYDLGPCVCCGATTHRYGAGGQAACNTCRGELTATFVAPTLYDPRRPCSWCGAPGLAINDDAYVHCPTHMWPPFRWPPNERKSA